MTELSVDRWWKYTRCIQRVKYSNWSIYWCYHNTVLAYSCIVWFVMDATCVYFKKVKSLSRISSSWASHLRTMGCHRSMVLTILLAARHKRAYPALTPAGEGWYPIYLPPRDGRLSWPECLITRRPGIEPMTAGSEVWRPNHCATEILLLVVRQLICHWPQC